MPKHACLSSTSHYSYFAESKANQTNETEAEKLCLDHYCFTCLAPKNRLGESFGTATSFPKDTYNTTYNQVHTYTYSLSWRGIQ